MYKSKCHPQYQNSEEFLICETFWIYYVLPAMLGGETATYTHPEINTNKYDGRSRYYSNLILYSLIQINC